MATFTHSIVEVENGSQFVVFVDVNETARISGGNGFQVAYSDEIYLVSTDSGAVAYDGRNTIVKLATSYGEVSSRGPAIVYNETDQSSGVFILNADIADQSLPFISGYLRYTSGLTDVTLTAPELSGYSEALAEQTIVATGTVTVDCNFSKHNITYTGTGEIKFNLTNVGVNAKEVMIRLDSSGSTTPSIAWQVAGVDTTPGYLGGAFTPAAEKRRLVCYFNDTGADTFEVAYSGVRS